MKTVHKVLAYLIALEVMIQAARSDPAVIGRTIKLSEVDYTVNAAIGGLWDELTGASRFVPPASSVVGPSGSGAPATSSSPIPVPTG